MATMRDYLERKAAAWHDHAEQFRCDHATKALRRRPIKGGQIHYVHQCLTCGEAQMHPLSKARALEASNGVEPAPFDDALAVAWRQRRSEASELVKRQFSRDAFFADYEQYLNSEAWAERRALVLKRAQGTCEGCGKRPATEVHHLDYAHVGNEFLFELVALCQPCHDRLHEDEGTA